MIAKAPGKYGEELAACPKVTVTPTEFAKRAQRAGWDVKTIILFLGPPPLEKYVKVGSEALLVKQ